MFFMSTYFTWMGHGRVVNTLDREVGGIYLSLSFWCPLFITGIHLMNQCTYSAASARRHAILSIQYNSIVFIVTQIMYIQKTQRKT